MPINLTKGQKVDLTKGNPGERKMSDRERIYLLR